MEEIRRVKRNMCFEGAIVDFYQDDMQMPDGTIHKWDLVHHRKGAAAVLPILPDGRILMVRQFRNALDRMTLEIPAGARDDVNEETVVCAARELEEETGYAAGKIEFLLNLRPTVAYCDEFIDIFVATDLKPGHTHPDEYEFVDVEKHELKELAEMIYAGKLCDGKTVAAIMSYLAKQKLFLNIT